MGIKEDTYALTAKGIIDNLKKRNMEGFFFTGKKEAVDYILSIMEKGASIAWGGSMSVVEAGLMDAIKNGEYNIIDRDAAKTPCEQREMFGKICTSDYFLMSTNAITLDGELVNIDGRGNRVAPLIYGPQKVILLVGMNKVTADIESAYKRIKTNACPPNGVRLKRNIPCAITGKCGNCFSEDCFCNQIVVTRRSGIAGRIKVVLVGEELGY